MSLETVVEDIREEARARADEIRDEGERRAEELLGSAREDAEAIREEAEREVEAEIEQERKQKVSSAKLEAKQARLEARRNVLEDVRERVEERIAGLDGDTRETLTRELLDAAEDEFEADETVYVYGRADDRELIESVLADYDGFEFGGERDCLGGVVVEGDRSRVRVNNTFDSIVEDVWEDNLREISDRLFEDG
jgi:V/A-type H+-transporting ATPase subunit E